MTLVADDTLLAALHARRILLKYNAPPPVAGSYGWLKRGDRLLLRGAPLRLEERCGLYGGPYIRWSAATRAAACAPSAASAIRTRRCPRAWWWDGTAPSRPACACWTPRIRPGC
jgi:hypothetical protein